LRLAARAGARDTATCGLATAKDWESEKKMGEQFVFGGSRFSKISKICLWPMQTDPHSESDTTRLVSNLLNAAEELKLFCGVPTRKKFREKKWKKIHSRPSQSVRNREPAALLMVKM